MSEQFGSEAKVGAKESKAEKEERGKALAKLLRKLVESPERKQRARTMEAGAMSTVQLPMMHVGCVLDLNFGLEEVLRFGGADSDHDRKRFIQKLAHTRGC